MEQFATEQKCQLNEFAPCFALGSQSSRLSLRSPPRPNSADSTAELVHPPSSASCRSTPSSCEGNPFADDDDGADNAVSEDAPCNSSAQGGLRHRRPSHGRSVSSDAAVSQSLRVPLRTHSPSPSPSPRHERGAVRGPTCDGTSLRAHATVQEHSVAGPTKSVCATAWMGTLGAQTEADVPLFRAAAALAARVAEMRGAQLRGQQHDLRNENQGCVSYKVAEEIDVVATLQMAIQGMATKIAASENALADKERECRSLRDQVAAVGVLVYPGAGLDCRLPP
eukprot:Opistho-2@43001